MRLPDFDPYALLDIDPHADAVAIDRAYKVRIRLVHPDIAGEAGLADAKRLNAARDWLLDPELRAQLPRPAGPSQPPPTSTWGSPPPPGPEAPMSGARPPAWTWGDPARVREEWEYDPLEVDPLTFDYGDPTDTLRSLFETIDALSDDERARLTWSLDGVRPASFDRTRHNLGDRRWHRSRALRDAVSTIWHRRPEEDTAFVLAQGRLQGDGAAVVDAYAQWLLLGALLAHGRDDGRVAEMQRAFTWPWEASIGWQRYGSQQRAVRTFLEDAGRMPVHVARRFADAWQRQLGDFLYGRPGEDWFPGTIDHPLSSLVSARVAAVDAARIGPPSGLAYEHHNAFRNAVRLTAHVLALGTMPDRERDYLGPWKAAVDANPTFVERARGRRADA